MGVETQGSRMPLACLLHTLSSPFLSDIRLGGPPAPPPPPKSIQSVTPCPGHLDPTSNLEMGWAGGGRCRGLQDTLLEDLGAPVWSLGGRQKTRLESTFAQASWLFRGADAMSRSGRAARLPQEAPTYTPSCTAETTATVHREKTRT